MIEALIIVGIVSIVVGFLTLLPGIGIGTVVPFVGDVLDVPLAAILILAGVIALLVGGLLDVILNIWPYIVGALVLYILFLYGLNKVGGRRRR